jgi:hypothetical protein
MNPFQCLTVFLAIFSVLLTGGRGLGTQVVICTEADGQVHVETPFDRCCTAADKHGDEALVVADAGVTASHDAALVSEGCGPCSDELVTLNTSHATTERGLKVVLGPDLHFPLFGIIQPLNSPGRDRDGRTHPSRLLSSPPAVQTTVLRC